MNDIVERLRDYGANPMLRSPYAVAMHEAADEINRLRASERSAWNAAVARDEEIERLRAERDALKADADRLDWIEAEASRHKVEFARSILGTGFEVGQWEPMKATVTAGNLRAAIDTARKA